MDGSEGRDRNELRNKRYIENLRTEWYIDWLYINRTSTLHKNCTDS